MPEPFDQRAQPSQLRELAALYDLAHKLIGSGDAPDAVGVARQLISEMEELCVADAGNVNLFVMLARCYALQGGALFASGMAESALAEFRKSGKLLEALASRDDSIAHDLMWICAEIGSVLTFLGRQNEAIVQLQRAIAVLEQPGRNPTDVRYRFGISLLYEGMGDALASAGRPEEALAAYRSSLGSREELGEILSQAGGMAGFEELRRRLLRTQIKIGETLVTDGRLDEAGRSFEQGLSIGQMLERAGHRADVLDSMVRGYLGLAKVLESSAEPGSAGEAYRRAAATAERLRELDLSYDEELALSTRNRGGITLRCESRRDRSDEPPPSAPKDVVEFGVSHPEECVVGVPFLLDAWIFKLGERESVAERATQESSEKTRFRSSGSAVVAHASELTIRIDMEPWKVEPATQTILWTGHPVNVSFRVLPTEPVPEGKGSGTCRIYASGLRIGLVLFEVRQAGVARNRIHLSQGSGVKSAFASYASKDRRRVLARVQGMEKLGVRVFMDVRDLKAGSAYPTHLIEQIDASDVLYLFWSRHAKYSPWVDREWRHGLQQHGMEFIDPVPLADPRKVPPPPELGDSKHFNDWTLAYLEYEKSASFWDRFRAWAAGD